jgi:hypothetical protein
MFSMPEILLTLNAVWFPLLVADCSALATAPDVGCFAEGWQGDSRRGPFSTSDRATQGADGASHAAVRGWHRRFPAGKGGGEKRRLQ